MSKDMGFFVYLGYISGYVREIPGVYARRPVYARADSVLYLQRLLSPLILPTDSLRKRQTIAARLSFTLAGGYHSHRLLSGALSRR